MKSDFDVAATGERKSHWLEVTVKQRNGIISTFEIGDPVYLDEIFWGGFLQHHLPNQVWWIEKIICVANTFDSVPVEVDINRARYSGAEQIRVPATALIALDPMTRLAAEALD